MTATVIKLVGKKGTNTQGGRQNKDLALQAEAENIMLNMETKLMNLAEPN